MAVINEILNDIKRYVNENEVVQGRVPDPLRTEICIKVNDMLRGAIQGAKEQSVAMAAMQEKVEKLESENRCLTEKIKKLEMGTK